MKMCGMKSRVQSRLPNSLFWGPIFLETICPVVQLFEAIVRGPICKGRFVPCPVRGKKD